MIKSKDKVIVVDFGQDFRLQMLRERIKKIDYALLTHSHPDHFASVTELRYAGPVVLEAPKDVLRDLDIGFPTRNYLKSRNPKIKIKVFKPKKIGNLFVDTIKVKHEKDYSNKGEPTYGYLFAEKNFRFAYIPDFEIVFEEDKIKNLDLLIADGTFFEKKHGHCGIEGGLELYRKFKPRRILFTHIHHKMVHKELKKYLKKFGNLAPAYDGQVIKSHS